MTEVSRTPTLAELLRVAIQSNQANLHTSLPGRIDSYDEAAQTADVKPLLQRTVVASDGTELAPESLPVLHDVPIAFPRGGGAFLSWPLQAGDLVHLVFVERSIDQYLGGEGKETRPLDFRMHSLSDAVAYPGFYPRSLKLASAHPENVVVGFDDGSQVHVKPGGEIHLASENAADFVALAGLVKSEIEALRTSVDALVTAYNAHAHTYVSPIGPLVTGPATPTAGPPPAVGDVAAEKVKAD